MNKQKSIRRTLLALFVVGSMAMSFTLATKSRQYEVNVEKSSVEWKAYKVGGSHQGEVALKSASFDAEGIVIKSGEFVVDMTTVKVTDTESEKLHRHLHSKDFFNTSKHPEAKLTITGSEKIDDKTIHVRGEMTIVGKTEPIEFDATVTGQTDNVIIYRADIRVDRTKYGIDYRSSLGDAFIMDEFDLDVKIAGIAADQK